MTKLFVRDKSVISRHLKSIFKNNELEENRTVAKFATVQKEGNRQIKRDQEYYNLDAIISVGYRVNSKEAIHFRQWATSVLKDHLIRGYTIHQKTLGRGGRIRIRANHQIITKNLSESFHGYRDRC